MGTYHFSCFAEVELLRRFHFPLLYQFLLPYRDYLCGKHDLRWTDHPDTFPYRQLASLFASPDTAMPDMLRSGLFFIDALSTQEGARKLAETLHQNGQLPTFPLNYHNCALYAWQVDPGLLQWVHTHLITTKNKVAEQVFSERPCYPDDSKERLIAWEDDLNAWMDWPDKRYGIQIMVYRRKQAVEFHLRYGELECLQSKSMTRRTVHRPERIDVLCCIPQERQVEIRSETAEDNRLHCFLFGKHCCNDSHYFNLGNTKEHYTLEPLRERGQNALICRDITGLNRVCLHELQVEQKTIKQRRQVFKAKKCLFEEYGTLDRFIGPKLNLIQASFWVYVSSLQTPQTLKIYAPGLFHFPRGMGFDEEIILWAKKRTFVQF